MISKEVRRWRKAARRRGAELVAWMQTRSGPVTLCDDDAAAVAEYVWWLDSQGFSVWDLLPLGD